MNNPLPWELEQALSDMGLPAPRKERKKLEQPVKGWTPKHPGEEPPF